LKAVEKGQSALLVSPTWEEIDRVTERVRERLKAAGTIGGKDVPFRVMDSLQWTAAQKRDVHRYEAGQVLLFHRKTESFSRHEAVKVIGVGKDFVRVERANGAVAQFHPVKGTSFDVCLEREIAVAPGDRLLLQGNRYNARLINGQVVEVEAVKGGRIVLKDGREIPPDYRTFCHGYAVTSHASQGKTVDTVLVVASSRSLPAVNREQFYVSVSRGRETCRVFTDDKELLRDRIARADEHKAALELGKIREALAKNGLLPTKRTEEAIKQQPQRLKEKGHTMRPLRLLRPLRGAMEPGREVNRATLLAKQFEKWVEAVRQTIAKVHQAEQMVAEKAAIKLRQFIEERRPRLVQRQRQRSRDFGMER
jgi:hypothetical protein